MKTDPAFIEKLAILSIDQMPTYPDLEVYSGYETNPENPSFLNFQGLHSFSKNVSDQQQEDVLNSLLLAQRAASKAFPEDEQIYDWYKLYFKVLENLGWLISNRDFNEFQSSDQTVEMDKAIVSMLQDVLTGQQIKILLKSLDLMRSLPADDRRFVAFKQKSLKNKRGNFQIGMTEEKNGNVSVLSSGFVLESESTLTDIFLMKLDQNKVKMNFSFYKADLVASEFDKVRDLVKEKLGNRNQFIASLDI